ncbi:hydrolase [Gluconacetobacter liquefaciens]|uniref:Alpha/beta hydrolase n=1 Tax=Gluconacetobacter liquefaciens TaxID=89584 RepID=A0A370G7E6_GLULI|nr:alpha/beta hydrolase [Gluconacetobacter liquefaciens]MBB2186311.1 alpha/beta hydrolase [Gluconacetobacter liquefaciens]RDI38849.1 haloacetate dehalogenase [Gluconacetobacter liquefaciens]GEB36489.1 hydrolase [Gluconacetobacter liquefaciens]
MFFGKLELTEVAWGNSPRRARLGGQGKLLVLLHGQMQSHAAWHAIAPDLADTHTVLCPDLPRDLDFRRQAEELLRLAQDLGHEHLAIAGHGTGGHVAAYAAWLAPERVTHVAEVECIPSPGHYGRADLAFELSRYSSCWFAQLHPKPESATMAVPEEWTRPAPHSTAPFSRPAVADYLQTMPAGETPGANGHNRIPPYPGDLRIACPLLVAWSREGRLGGWYNPADLWRPYATGPLNEAEIASGYYIPEEAPKELLDALSAFLTP